MATSMTGAVTKRMLISVDRDEARAAVVEDNQLVHLEIEPANRNTCKGNIYRAVVARVEPSLQSAFVDFGNDKQGFLPVGEIHPKLRGGNHDKRAPIQDLLKARTEIMVQVVRDEIGQKGATLSTFISLPGRYLVLIPESDNEKAGVSRKLSDEARDRVKKLTETMKVPDGFGLIVRTAGDTATELELVKDLTYLTRQWEHIVAKNDEGKGPQLLYAERSLPVRFVRDYFTKDIEEVVIDDDATLQEVGEFLQVLMPRGLAAVVRYAGDMPLFARYGVEGKVEDVFARQVFLPSGGSIVIDQTEAMVAIDVNSGRMKEKDIEETARATNIEAAQEIARQMILRDMGGLIVVDFIDMREKKYVREVEQAVKDAFKNDKARTKLGHISEFGLLEMSRQRIKSSVNKGTFDSCPHCSGIGRIRSMESVGASVLRRIYDTVAKKDTATQKRVRAVMAMVPPAAARYLLNSRRHELYVLEKQYHLTIEIVPVDGLCASQVVLEHLEEIPVETSDERADRQRLLRVTQELDLVRNQLIKREEVRVTLEMAAARRSAKVDYAEIYAKVREATGPAEMVEKANAEAVRKAAEVVRAPVVAEEETWLEEAPQPKGFWSGVMNFLGLAEPPPPPQKKVVKAAPTPPAPVAVAAPQDNPRPPREHREHRDRDHRDSREQRDGRDNREPRENREQREAREPRPAMTLDANAPRLAGRDAPEGREGPRDQDRDGRRRRRGRGDRPEGQRSEGLRPENVRPEGQRMEGQRPMGVSHEAAVEVREEDETLGAPVETPVVATAAAGSAEVREGGQRRRRRRRRGGRDASGNLETQNEDGTQADDGEGDDAMEAAGEDAAGDDVAGEDAGAAETVIASGEEGAEPALTAADVEAPAGGAVAAADEAPVVEEPAEEAVDVSAAIAEEIARLREAAGTPEPTPEPPPPVEPPSAKNRFVVDLRSR
jgi:ribonuclease E